MAYPTLEEVKTWLGITLPDDDALLTQLQEFTEAIMEDYLGRRLSLAEYKQESYKPRTEQFHLRNYPVNSITSISLDDASGNVTDYHLSIDTGSLYGNFTSVDVLTIVYQGGYTELPKAIESVYLKIVEDGYNDKKGISDEDVKDVTIFDFAKVSYQTDSSSRSLTYSGVGSSGEIPSELTPYLGVLNQYRSDGVLMGGDGIN